MSDWWWWAKWIAAQPLVGLCAYWIYRAVGLVK